MGIGVSYTGYDGKTRNAVAESTADLQRIMGATRRSQTGDSFGKRRSESTAMPDIFKNDPVDGPLIGIEGNASEDPDGQRRSVGASGGWRIPVPRTEMTVTPDDEEGYVNVSLTKLQYDLIISERGFVKGRTEERVIWHKTFLALASGGGGGSSEGGQYEVRPEWTTLSGDGAPRLAALYFGSGKDLKGSISEVKNREGVTMVPVYTHGELT